MIQTPSQLAQPCHDTNAQPASTTMSLKQHNSDVEAMPTVMDGTCAAVAAVAAVAVAVAAAAGAALMASVRSSDWRISAMLLRIHTEGKSPHEVTMLQVHADSPCPNATVHNTEAKVTRRRSGNT